MSDRHYRHHPAWAALISAHGHALDARAAAPSTEIMAAIDALETALVSVGMSRERIADWTQSLEDARRRSTSEDGAEREAKGRAA